MSSVDPSTCSMKCLVFGSSVLCPADALCWVPGPAAAAAAAQAAERAQQEIADDDDDDSADAEAARDQGSRQPSALPPPPPKPKPPPLLAGDILEIAAFPIVAKRMRLSCCLAVML